MTDSTTPPAQRASIVTRFGRAFHRVFLAPMPLEDFKDYNDYWDRRPDPPILNRYRQVAEALPDKGSVVDIGCGDGTFLAYLQDKRPNLKARGIDISEVAIAKVMARGLRGDVCDLTHEGLQADLKADNVVMMEVLEHVADAETLMHAAAAIDAKHYYVTLPNLGHIEHRLRLGFAGKMPVTAILYHIKEHLRFWTVSDFTHWADRMGFRVVRVMGQNGTLFFWRFWPSLFAMQVTYILEKKVVQD
jgi:methionine biosynthesis protein MetW